MALAPPAIGRKQLFAIAIVAAELKFIRKQSKISITVRNPRTWNTFE